MGVSGSGKSTVGAAVADALGVPFEEGDDLHPEANVRAMSAGTPLTDESRAGWLDEVGRWLASHPAGGVISCSALKRSYRDRLRRHAPDVVFLHLAGSPELVARRQAERTGHFMPARLLPSQYADLEPLEADEAGYVVDVAAGPEEVVEAAVTALTSAG
ncbi:gluconokinase [Nocardioides donggukensis]|uniref:Gluconokinase n=1 Tax=Nocardioides donggukensis TaxID=2774019 RepID=A0A927K4W1_9ACTN|nr:gluconokinase [Nocardioides donggukensis]MBD8870564.1 gluconokinase [Nocardioides donggukensis]